ncbi:hypothetical protein BRADI_4g21155v3 [Brachypodium distachyon]|uniref:Uncharacterized protein n=1 Tax=Brachypodium distachyon TaxID=15368 RepID=A0A0Q3EMQ6_BRADI|nr:hypothetical protein BRADI_4g21155v3 [Brachypodium distachyon]
MSSARPLAIYAREEKLRDYERGNSEKNKLDPHRRHTRVEETGPARRRRWFRPRVGPRVPISDAQSVDPESIPSGLISDTPRSGPSSSTGGNLCRRLPPKTPCRSRRSQQQPPGIAADPARPHPRRLLLLHPWPALAPPALAPGPPNRPRLATAARCRYSTANQRHPTREGERGHHA